MLARVTAVMLGSRWSGHGLQLKGLGGHIELLGFSLQPAKLEENNVRTSLKIAVFQNFILFSFFFLIKS